MPTSITARVDPRAYIALVLGQSNMLYQPFPADEVPTKGREVIILSGELGIAHGLITEVEQRDDCYASTVQLHDFTSPHKRGLQWRDPGYVDMQTAKPKQIESPADGPTEGLEEPRGMLPGGTIDRDGRLAQLDQERTGHLRDMLASLYSVMTGKNPFTGWSLTKLTAELLTSVSVQRDTDEVRDLRVKVKDLETSLAARQVKIGNLEAQVNEVAAVKDQVFEGFKAEMKTVMDRIYTALGSDFANVDFKQTPDWYASSIVSYIQTLKGKVETSQNHASEVQAQYQSMDRTLSRQLAAAREQWIQGDGSSYTQFASPRGEPIKCGGIAHSHYIVPSQVLHDLMGIHTWTVGLMKTSQVEHDRGSLWWKKMPKEEMIALPGGVVSARVVGSWATLNWGALQLIIEAWQKATKQASEGPADLLRGRNVILHMVGHALTGIQQSGDFSQSGSDEIVELVKNWGRGWAMRFPVTTPIVGKEDIDKARVEGVAMGSTDAHQRIQIALKMDSWPFDMTPSEKLTYEAIGRVRDASFNNGVSATHKLIQRNVSSKDIRLRLSMGALAPDSQEELNTYKAIDAYVVEQTTAATNHSRSSMAQHLVESIHSRRLHTTGNEETDSVLHALSFALKGAEKAEAVGPKTMEQIIGAICECVDGRRTALFIPEGTAIQKDRWERLNRALCLVADLKHNAGSRGTKEAQAVCTLEDLSRLLGEYGFEDDRDATYEVNCSRLVSWVTKAAEQAQISPIGWWRKAADIVHKAVMGEKQTLTGDAANFSSAVEEIRRLRETGIVMGTQALFGTDAGAVHAKIQTLEWVTKAILDAVEGRRSTVISPAKDPEEIARWMALAAALDKVINGCNGRYAENAKAMQRITAAARYALQGTHVGVCGADRSSNPNVAKRWQVLNDIFREIAGKITSLKKARLDEGSYIQGPMTSSHATLALAEITTVLYPEGRILPEGDSLVSEVRRFHCQRIALMARECAEWRRVRTRVKDLLYADADAPLFDRMAEAGRLATSRAG